jgi:hypothetical protein
MASRAGAIATAITVDAGNPVIGGSAHKGSAHGDFNCATRTVKGDESYFCHYIN